MSIKRQQQNKRHSSVFPQRNRDLVAIENIVEILKDHFFHPYGIAGASRLPVLAVYSVYELLIECERYKDKKLCPLKSHTTSDLKSASIGDIEMLDENGEFFEGVEVKHAIAISPTLVQDAFDKFANTPIHRYYLLTTAEPHVENSDTVRKLTRQIQNRHGCEVIMLNVVDAGLK